MERNTLLAVILSVVVLFVWAEFFGPKPDPNAQKAENKSVQVTEPEKKAEKPAEQAAATANLPTGTVAPSIANEVKTGSIQTGVMRLDYTSIGGYITRASVTEGKYKNKDLNMLAALQQGQTFPAMSSIFSREPNYTVADKSDNRIKFAYEQDGLTEIKEIEETGDYVIKITKTIINRTAADITYRPAIRYDSIHSNADVFSSYGKVFEILAAPEGSGLNEISDAEELTKTLAEKPVQWVGVNYGFFLFALINDGRDLAFSGDVNKDQNHTFLTASKKDILIPAGKSASWTFTLFLGPKEGKYLNAVGNGLENSIDLGWFSFLAKPLLWLLNFFYQYVSNYGIAIILLTILVKLLLWPLSDASYKSMSKMKKLMPKVEELKKKYKDDKESLNKETMLLYQKEGVNPLGGCLPIFIQMPIYIALYSMLNNAVELYNTPFLPFWLTDLSEKDPFFILPVALGGFMFIQQKMMPTQMDNAQAKIMLYAMPIMFAGFMLFLPSGLNLYILANTLLGIAQQSYVNKKYA